MLKSLLIIFLAALLGFQAHAASFTFDSTIVFVELDDGTGSYAGTSVDDTFSGTFVFGDRPSDAVSVSISGDSGEYGFLGSNYRSIITNGSITTDSFVVVTGPGNDGPISDMDSGLLSSLFGINIPAQTPIDSLGAFGNSPGSFYDENDIFKNGIEFGILLFLDTSTYTDVDLKTSPPAAANVIGSFFFVSEADAAGNEKFRAYGTIENLSLGPFPICDIEMNQAVYLDNETIIADTFRIANLTGATRSLEIKIWLGVPGNPPIDVSLGATDTFDLPDGTDIDLGPASLLTVTQSWPRGDYEFSCRMLEPVTGELLAEDRNFFELRDSP